MVRALSAFLDFCYLVRRSVLNEATLDAINAAIDRFHQERTVFITSGVHAHLSLPRQHAMVHYCELIELFGAPNGFCSSITESKHIRAVKEPWRRSNRFNALGQMLVTNQRLDKLAAARRWFTERGMLDGVSQSVDLGRSNNPNTTPTKDYEKVRVVVCLRGVQRGCAEEGKRGSTPTG